MLFNSYVFIFAFLPVVLVGFALLRRLENLNWAIVWLTAASLFFYGWWKAEFLLLILTSIIANLIFGKILMAMPGEGKKSRLVLIAGLAFNLALLGYFKYANFFVSNVNTAFGSNWTLPQILLPIGISFITFQKIAFLVDAYRGKVKDFSVLNYCFFVTFFPQLIAGPIVHHAEVMPQLKEAPRRDFSRDFAIGCSIFIIGLFKKVVIADTLAVYADAGYAAVAAGQTLDFASAWVAVLSYSFQLYYDFSGYSEMAVGLGRMFGIRLPVNFLSPYKSASIVEFWRRWHITLSRFLRDYLYIPLGGNRHGPLRRYLHLGLVMLLGGLWHGANWTFAVWGVLHGLMLAINHAWAAIPLSQSRWLRGAPARIFFVFLTFLLVTLAWVPFRSPGLSQATTMLGFLMPGPGALVSFKAFVTAQYVGIFGAFDTWFTPRELWPPVLPPNYLATMAKPVGLLLALVTALTFLMPNTYRLLGRFEPAIGIDERLQGGTGILSRLGPAQAVLLGFMFVVSVLGLARVSPFLYFQF
ncbi:MBOAT family O-acyltransferase [Bosea sp. 124]|uniref:MBOAT family O-acyltransferase n=1 Tax=Bosea sp. 124 TaxID=2135642 RepID=UPI000D3677E3|nr:MBOAT family O-acyltransferase [Bosea sp. 124]